jgi:DNA-binding transcriptional LysR family regulator
MDRFQELTTFVEVARLGGFSAAAREEGVTPAMIARRIDQLEARLGVKLVQRSTRAVTLTEEGVTFLDDAQRVLADLASAEDALSSGARDASGRLVVTAPTAFGRRHIAPHVPDFLRRHPRLGLTLLLSERLMDLKNERIDLAVRIADLRNADLVATRLALNRRVVVAAPAYLQAEGVPEGLADLARHACLVTATEDGVADTWHFQQEGRAVAVRVPTRLTCNDGGVLTQWALAGLGLAWRSAWEVGEDIARGRLVTVLDRFTSPTNHIYAVYPQRRHLPAKVRLFIAYLKERFGDPPYWEA